MLYVLCSPLRSAGARDNLLWIDKGHHAAQLASDLLDLVLTILHPHAVEVGPALMIFLDPFLGKSAALDIGQQFAHSGLGLLVDDARPGMVVPVLGRIADRVAHIVKAALVEQ